MTRSEATDIGGFNMMAALRDARFLAALGVLLANDLVLKVVWPGVVSGKLSDIAGMVFFPVVLTAIVGLIGHRLPPKFAVGVVAAWFVGLQVLPVVDRLHESLLASLLPWSPTNTADPTDLVALLAIPLAARVLENPKPLDLSLGLKRTVLVLACCAALAESSPRVELAGPPLATEDGTLEVLRSSEWESGLLISHDEGRTYVEQAHDESVDIEELLDAAPGVREVCLVEDETHCFRLGTSVFVVEESNDGGSTWNRSWAITEDAYLLRSDGNSFSRPDERRRGLAVLTNDTVIVTTGIGPTLRWTDDDGWTPSARSLRTTYWMLIAWSGALSVLALTVPLLRCGRAMSLTGSVVGLTAAVSSAQVAFVADFQAFYSLAFCALVTAVWFFAILAGGFQQLRMNNTRLPDRRVGIAVLVVAVAAALPFLAWLLVPRIPLTPMLTLTWMAGVLVSVALYELVAKNSVPMVLPQENS